MPSQTSRCVPTSSGKVSKGGEKKEEGETGERRSMGRGESREEAVFWPGRGGGRRG